MIDYLMHEIHPLLSILVMMVSLVLVATIGVAGMYFFHGKKYCAIPYFICVLLTYFVPDVSAIFGTRKSIAEQIQQELDNK